MLLRDVPGYCLYFIPYTLLCDWSVPEGGVSPSPSSVWLAGGAAGKQLLFPQHRQGDRKVPRADNRGDSGATNLLVTGRGHGANDLPLPPPGLAALAAQLRFMAWQALWEGYQSLYQSFSRG